MGAVQLDAKNRENKITWRWIPSLPSLYVVTPGFL
jgi:hypothetical protein